RERRIAAEAERFAEELMPQRLAARQSSAVRVRLAGRLNRIDDAAVSGAATDMAVERFGHHATVRRALLLDERCRADDDARNAEAALHAPFEDERVADRSAHPVRQSLDRHDVAAVRLFRLAQAR